MSLLHLWEPPKPPKATPTFVHLMRGKWANPPVTEERQAQMAEYNRKHRKKKWRKCD